MGTDMIGSDPLGAKGENRFQEICEDAGLICNKATRDRAGWDFIVEFQFDNGDQGHSLDGRTVPLSCHVQGKTLLAQNDRFKVRLSSAERLAKEIKPAFIYVFKVVGTDITDAYLIHIIGNTLERILKRLREMQAAGQGDRINKKFISFSAARYGKRIEPTGHALQVAIQEACGRDLHEYYTRKAGQIRGLGFEPFPVTGTFRFRSVGSLDELVEVVLGVQQNVEIEHLQAFETRFGIPLPLREFSPNTHRLSIQPPPIDTCTVTVRNDELGSPSVFNAELFIPPIMGLPARFFRFLVRSPLFSFLIPFEGQLTFWFEEDIRAQKHPPERLVDLARFLLALSVGKANIEVRTNNRADYIEWNVNEITTVTDPISCRRWLTVCEYTVSLFRSAGVSRDLGISIQDIDETGKDIIEAYACLNGKVNELTFRTTRPEGAIEADTPTRTLVVNYARIGEVILGYYILVDLVPEVSADLVWRSQRIAPGQIRQVRRASEDFANFVEYARTETNVNMFLVQRSPMDDLARVGEASPGTS
jgi:hypothetical protein